MGQKDSIIATLPLQGVRILDLSRVLAGPFCSMLLGDLGAHVLKVERPGTGDDSREWGPPFDSRGESAYYLSINRNKFSIAADFAADRDRELVQGLVTGADVVLENFLPGTLDRFGLGAATMLARHSALIWCTISGFGADSTRPGYDFVVQAECGWMSITGESSGEPMKAGIALADLMAGKDAAIAILAALAGRQRAGIERHIRISLADSARAALTNVAQNALVSGTDARRWGNAHANLVPYQLFHAKDRPFVLAVGNDEQWRTCVAALGLADLADDGALTTNRGRLAQRDHVVSRLQEALGRQPASHWLAVLGDAGVPCGIVKTVLETIADAGDVSPLTGMPSSLGMPARKPPRRPPTLDEHGALVRELGWDAFRVTP